MALYLRVPPKGPIYPVTRGMHFLVMHLQQALASCCAKASTYTWRGKERKTTQVVHVHCVYLLIKVLVVYVE